MLNFYVKMHQRNEYGETRLRSLQTPWLDLRGTGWGAKAVWREGMRKGKRGRKEGEWKGGKDRHRGRHTKIFGWAKSLPPPLSFLSLYLFFPSPVSLHPLRSRLLK